MGARIAALVAVVATVAVVACGDDPVHHLPDAAPIGRADAAIIIDASPDAPPNLAVTALARCCDDPPGTPIAGATVLAIAPGGTALERATTDAAGNAALSIAPGSTVAAIAARAGSAYDLTTIGGVQPGDHLTFGSGYYRGNTHGTAGTATIQWPALAGTQDYFIVSPCFEGAYVAPPATSVSVELVASCQTPTAPVIAIAYGMTGVPIIGSAYVAAATYTDGATIVLPAWTAQAATNFDVSVSGMAADVDFVDLAAHLDVPPFLTDFELITRRTNVGGTASAALEQPVVGLAVAGAVPSGLAVLGKSTTTAQQYVYRTGATPLAIAAPAALPWVDDLAIAAGNAAVTWTITGGDPAAYDAVVLELQFSLGGAFVRWHAILPPGATSLDIAANLPAALAAYLPIPTTTISAARVDLLDLPGVDGYDALRAQPEWRIIDAAAAVHAGDLTGATYARVSTGIFSVNDY